MFKPVYLMNHGDTGAEGRRQLQGTGGHPSFARVCGLAIRRLIGQNYFLGQVAFASTPVFFLYYLHTQSSKTEAS